MSVEHKITLIGPIPSDHITTWKNESLHRYGCLTYPSIALSNLLGRSARITPVTHVRKKDQQTIKAILKGHPGIELLHINADLDMGDVMRLQFINKSRSLGKQYGFMNPIMPDNLKHLLDSHYFVFLPVTDYEISLETLQFVNSYSEGEVVFDAHGSTTAMTSLGDRITKFWVDRDLWLPYIDILTMSLEQLKYCWFAKEYSLEELESGVELSEQDMLSFAEHCFDKGVKAIYVTLGNDGCLVFTSEEGKVALHRVKPVNLGAEIIDTTGREESFVAGMVFGLLKHNEDYEKAAQFGNVLSAQRGRSMDYDVFDSLVETLQQVEDTYDVKYSS